MTAANRRGVLARAIDNGIVELVGINEVKFLRFGEPARGRPVTLGVRGLSACSVVIMVSNLGAIVAHVGPNTPGATAVDSFIRLAESKMDEVTSLYRQNHDCFRDRSNAYVIYAEFRDEPTSPEQIAIFRQRLQQLGIPINKGCSYQRSRASLIDESRPEGTVWVVRPRDSSPVVYLEDHVITPGVGASSSTTQSGRSQVASLTRTVPATTYSYHASMQNAPPRITYTPQSSLSTSSRNLSGTWTWSSTAGLQYHLVGSAVAPQSLWPAQRGRVYVMVEGQRRIYNFDSRTWERDQAESEESEDEDSEEEQ